MADGLVARVVAQVGRLRLDVDLESSGSTLVVVGPNGAGKTSLLRALLGALPVELGRIALGGRLLLDSAAGLCLPVEERRLGYLPQDYALFPHLTVRGNLAFAHQSAAEAGPAVDPLLQQLGLQALADRMPRSLSGGEQQRVALARALAAGPRALLLDEPLAALDVHARREVRAFLAQWLTQQRLPTVLVTHDAADAQALGSRIAVLEEGRVTQTGTWDELAAHPATRFVEELLASAPSGR
jgi:molybdate transport system ATP-binding protein